MGGKLMRVLDSTRGPRVHRRPQSARRESPPRTHEGVSVKKVLDYAPSATLVAS